MIDKPTAVFPLVGYETFLLPGASFAASIVIFLDEAAMQKGETFTFPVAMTSTQARGLASALLLAAGATEMKSLPVKRRN